MEQQGMTRKDLEPIIGSRARVSEVLNGKRALTLSMIRRLHAGLSIPVDLLIGPLASPLRRAATHKRSARNATNAASRQTVAQSAAR
jgi:transcriptional regulator with XRE-family HTH domain